MDNSLPPADELALVDRELARLDARRSQLLARRAWLIRVLYAPGPTADPSKQQPATADSTPRSAQNVLLVLGGTLLTIAAVAFTLVSWGSMGIGARATVLAAVTTAALAAPVALLRRELVSTAESVAALGLVLMVLDAYALHRVALPGTDGPGYAAAAATVLAGAWTAYGSALPRLRLPLPSAVVAAQLPLPLGVLAAGGGPTAVAWAALLTATADAAAVLWARPAAVRVTAATVGTPLGGWALLEGGRLSLVSPGSGALLLLAGAVVALCAAWRVPAVTVAFSVVAGLAVLAAFGGLLRTALPADWWVPGYASCALALALLWRPTDPAGEDSGTGRADHGAPGTDRPGGDRGTATGALRRLPGGLRTGLAGAGAAVAALGVAWALPPVAAGALGPVVRRTEAWSGEHGAPLLDPYPSTAVLVLAAAAASLAVLPRLWARCGSLCLAWALLTALPVSLGLPYPATLALQVLTTAAALWCAVVPAPLTRGLHAAGSPAVRAGAPAPARPRGQAPVVRPGTALGWGAFAVGLASAVDAVALALDVRTATFLVLGAVFALFSGVAVLGADARRGASAATAVLAAAGTVSAVAAAGGFEDHWTALALLLVPAGTAAVASRAPRPVGLPAEVAGAAVGVLALGITAPRPAFLALALALCGVIASATALRPERRRSASWTAAVLFLLAAWVRLAVWDVTAPEAYALPVTVPALVVGLSRRRRDPAASSWTAYGPGLAVTLVPSLLAAWTDQGWVRPLVLGVAALAVTLLGARFRLQALLVLGGAVLALDGLHELAPYVVQVVGALPRWLPPALAGLLLLATGATYEQRLRDAKGLRERLMRMR
ncbi:SCO7613 C-terminal domain-containing membrane protein [Streptomyces sp. NPDC058872]|uniref:SCO7613 C-terminal domain-containing membrane protein n=1 Tax=Streptomyces sp. NPDC058872 TaxID=3346661 RepID=UPI003674FBF2